MNIYVSNLGLSFGDEDLRKLFLVYGTVNVAQMLMEKFGNQGKGIGLVEMPDAMAAQKAIRKLNGSSLRGRVIKVYEAKPQQEMDARKKSFYKK